MSGFSSAAIILRRRDFSDYDVLIDFLTREQGRLTAIAKNAKKSKKRFSGVLELFSGLEAVFVYPKSGGLPLLSEAFLTHPFAGLRGDIEKIAYASYWAEMINRSAETGTRQPGLFRLLSHVLGALAENGAPRENLSLLFQVRFLNLAGLAPGFDACRLCRQPVARLPEPALIFDVARGGVVCRKCLGPGPGTASSRLLVSRRILKQLLWLQNNDLGQAGRVRFSPADQAQGLKAMERFVQYHLSTEIKSLKVLRRLRDKTGGRNDAP